MSGSASNSQNLPSPFGGGGGGGKPMWLPMLVGGLFATLAVSGSALVGLWYRKRAAAAADESSDLRDLPAPRGVRPGKHREREARSLVKLRAAIVGNDKDAIVKVLGPPPTTGGYSIGSVVQSGQPEYYRADTWYYPMDTVRQRAIAIEFSEGVARSAAIIEAPSHI